MDHNQDYVIDTGYSRFRIAKLPRFARREMAKMYQNTNDYDDVDFKIELKTQGIVRRVINKQLDFYVDDFAPFRPVPYREAYAFLEWSMNWCVTALISTELMIHAAVLEKNGKAVIFPAPPGSGKSTLTAHLMLNGWRLLSDEMTIINLSNGMIYPSVRPICLKNNSIDLVKSWRTNLQFTTPITDTNKGTVAHLKPTENSFVQRGILAQPVGVFYPKYMATTECELFEITKTDSFSKLVANAFNFSVLGQEAFDALANTINDCWHFEGHYNDLNIVQEFLEYQIE